MATLFQQYCNRLATDALGALGIRPVKALTFGIEGLAEGIELDGLFGEANNSFQ